MTIPAKASHAFGSVFDFMMFICIISAALILLVLYLLIKAFIFALSQQDKIPEKILFYNGGVKLTTENDASIDDLKSMAERGTRIYSCGTCLSFYGLTEQLKVGEVTNMYDIVDMQMKAARILKP